MTGHLPGCPVAESTVPASTCTPCMYIRKGIELGRAMPLADPRHEPGIGSLLVGPPAVGSLFRTASGWTTQGGMNRWPWPDLTARTAIAGQLRVAYSTTPLPGRLEWLR